MLDRPLGRRVSSPSERSFASGTRTARRACGLDEVRLWIGRAGLRSPFLWFSHEEHLVTIGALPVAVVMLAHCHHLKPRREIDDWLWPACKRCDPEKARS